MDKLIDLGIQYGPTFAAVTAILLGLLYLVVWFIQRELKSYETRMERLNLKIAGYEGKVIKAGEDFDTSIKVSVESIKKEFGLIKFSVGAMGDTIDTFKSHITQQVFKLTVQSNEIHERSEKIKLTITEAMDKVGRVLELKDKVEVSLGRVIALENKTASESKSHRENMTTVADHLKRMHAEIAALKKGSS